MGKVIVFVLMLFSLIANSIDRDLGKAGQTFRIREESFIEMLKRKLEKVDMEKEKEKMEKQVRERIENPLPVVGVKLAEEDRTFFLIRHIH